VYEAVGRLLDLAALTKEHVLRGHGNPDGMHWGWTGHEKVGRAMAALVSNGRTFSGATSTA
jgi:hypothetical protein